MSSPLIKVDTNGQPENNCIVSIQIFSNGATELKSSLAPEMLCGTLFKLVMGIMFQSFQKVEPSRIQNLFDKV